MVLEVDKMEIDKLSALLFGFIIILVGIITIGVISDSTYENTNIYGVINESLSISSGAGQTAQDDLVSVSSFANASATVFTIGDGLNVIGQTQEL